MSTHPNSVITAPNPVWTFPEALQQLLGDGEEEFVMELIDVFKSQTQERMQLLREAFENSRLDEARAQAHTIKGGSSQVGADRLAAVCLEIETGAGLTEAELAALVSRAESLFEDVRRMISVPGRV
jgi:HPt (histidine-containing phosphotransfer) domain-containing protein